jgi:hypothetical protein
MLALSLRASAASGDEAAARALFAEGRKLVDEGNYVEACPKFEESLRLDPGTGTSFNLADCFERVGRTASAWARFLDVAAASKADGQVDRERVARMRAERLEPLLARLVIEVKSPIQGLVVERDGVLVGEASWGVPVPVDPGERRLRATAPGMKPWSGTAAVPEGPTTIVAAIPTLETLPPEQPKATPLAPSVPPPAAAAATESRWTVPVVALGAASAAAFATSVIFGLQVHAKNEEAESLCPGSSCATPDEKTDHDELVAGAHRDRNIAIVSAGIGGAALLTGAYLFFAPFESPPAKSRASRATFRPVVRPLAVELEVTW